MVSFVRKARNQLIRANDINELQAQAEAADASLTAEKAKIARVAPGTDAPGPRYYVTVDGDGNAAWMPERYIDFTHPDIGGVASASVDNSAALVLALAAQAILKIPIYARAGEYGFTGTHAIPWGMLGDGSSQTQFHALDDTASLRLTGARVTYGGFAVWGNEIAEVCLEIGSPTTIINQAKFTDIHARGATVTGWLFNCTQNCRFSSVSSYHNKGVGATFDNASQFNEFGHFGMTENEGGDLLFVSTDTHSSGFGDLANNGNLFTTALFERRKAAVTSTATGGTGTTLVDSSANWPVDRWVGAWVTRDPAGGSHEGFRITANTSDTLTIDGTWAVTPTTEAYNIVFPSIRAHACDVSTFVNLNIAHLNLNTDCPLIHCRSQDGTIGAGLVLQNAQMQGTANYGAGIVVDGATANANVVLIGRTYIARVKNGLVSGLASGRAFSGTSWAVFNTVADEYVGSASSYYQSLGEMSILFGADAQLLRTGTNMAGVGSGDSFSILSGHLEMGEITDPSAPSSNRGRAYFRDNGSGKTQFCVRFPTGAVQVIATEP